MAKKRTTAHAARKNAEIEARCSKVSAMYLQGKTYHEIAETLSVSRDTIRNDMKRVRRSWRLRYERSYTKHVSESLAKLDQVECAAWDGWQRSLKDDLTTGTEEGTRGDSAVDVTHIKRRKQSGNASFLKVIMDCVRQRCEILGLNDPDARNQVGETDAAVCMVVIEDREEAAEFQQLSINGFKDAISEANEERQEAAEL